MHFSSGVLHMLHNFVFSSHTLCWTILHKKSQLPPFVVLAFFWPQFFFSSSYTAKCQNLMQQIIKDHREHSTFFPHSSIEHFSALIFSKKLQHVHFQKKCNVFFLLSLLSFKQSFKPPCLKNKVKRFCVLFGIDHRCDEFCISKPASAALVALAIASPNQHQQL